MTADKPFVVYFKVSFQYLIRGSWLTLRIAAKVKNYGSYICTHSINTYFKADTRSRGTVICTVTMLQVGRTGFPTPIVARDYSLF